MALTAEQRQKIVADYKTHDKDSGSTQLQIALLTEDIRALTEHLKKHKKDFHTRRGLMKRVGRRNRLLRYLHGRKPAEYAKILERLGLRR